MARPKRDNDLAARILVDAALNGDRKAYEKHKISDRTLRNYRAALEKDAELSARYAQLSGTVATQHWAEELNQTLTAGIRKMLQLINRTNDPKQLPKVTEAVGVLSEIAMTREMLEAEDDQLSPKSALVTDQPSAMN